MKKFMFIVLITSLLSVRISSADPVSQEEARKIAVSWYTHMAVASVSDDSVQEAFPVIHDNRVTMYVFNFTSGGFVIVAADDASVPILGYSEENSFPADMSCPAVESWMEDYSKQIEQIITRGLSNRETVTQWDAIMNGNFPVFKRSVAPLLTTTWDQGRYYNQMCPADPQGVYGHAVTGCVATAMAQIMKYHNFPPQGVGSHAYLHPYYGELSADFGNTAYDWTSMPHNVTSDNIPVATLMYHAGVAVNMYYGPVLSGTNSPIYKTTLVDYFNYQPDIELHYQPEYAEIEDWKNMLRADLDCQLPILYTGQPSIGWGHAFVCDGYQLIPELGIDRFHFNWGWSGFYDGWYIIGTLNPGNNDFSFNNLALTGIKPGHPGLITRITHPVDNFIFNSGQSIEIQAATVYGSTERMKITIDGMTVATGTSSTLSYTWITKDEDIGSHEVRSWSFSGNDSVYYPVIMNVNDDWIKQSSGFQTPYCINYISAVDSNVAWAIARDWNDVFNVPCQAFTRTINGGETWMAGNIPDCEDLTFTMIQGVSAQKAYASLFSTSVNAPQGIFITLDGGNTWERQHTAAFSNKSTCSSVHFFNENDGWCMGDPVVDGNGTYEMFVTGNGGENWIPVPAASIPPSIFSEMSWFGPFSAINDTLWFGTSCGRIFKSTDKGYTWTVTQVYETVLDFLIPVFRNSSHGLVFNTTGHLKLYETFDGGESWEAVDYTGPLYQTNLAYVPGTVNTWISTGGMSKFRKCGASYSTDGGHTWTAFTGTEGIDFRNMAWVNPRCGWAGGHNSSATEGGIFKFNGNLGTPYGTNDHDISINPFTVYPNPFGNSATIEFELPHSADVEITIFNLLGEQVDAMTTKHYPRGKHQVTWNASYLPDGIYFIQMKAGEAKVTGKVLKMR
ncbi:MAG TPA: C10 family peptidase [Bacteroidales bacterium]|nr:C10 family peptidase [Bacteroidales bacterium]